MDNIAQIRDKNALFSHGAYFAFFEGKFSHLSPYLADGTVKYASPGLRIAGAGIDIARRGDMHPAGGGKAAEVAVRLRN